MQRGSAEYVQVVAAVISDHAGRILLAQRPQGKVYAGYWEFPGGKIEPGESGAQALARELHEELGITVACAYPWITRRYTYTHARVELHFYRVVRFEGEMHAREAQSFRWQDLDAIDVAPILPANDPILAALRLPSIYAITNAHEMGEAPFIHALERRLRGDLRLIQVREPHMSVPALERFASTVVAKAHAHRARVLVNEQIELARRIGADGVHLKGAQLASLKERPQLQLVGASCHHQRELDLAMGLGADFAVLGPVAPTPSHPGAATIGWHAFEQMIRGLEIPVYALGGMRMADLEPAWMRGAHGIGMQRGAWDIR